MTVPLKWEEQKKFARQINYLIYLVHHKSTNFKKHENTNFKLCPQMFISNLLHPTPKQNINVQNTNQNN